MGIILWIVFGAIVGVIASTIMGTKETLAMDVIIGILGAFIGGFIMNLFDNAGVTGFNLYSLFVSVLGSVLLIWIVRKIKSA